MIAALNPRAMIGGNTDSKLAGCADPSFGANETDRDPLERTVCRNVSASLYGLTGRSDTPSRFNPDCAAT